MGNLSGQPIQLFSDNKAACDIAHNLVQHDRIKYIEVDRFFIKKKLDLKIVELPRIKSKDQLANILTKTISYRSYSSFLGKLDMCNIYAPTYGRVLLSFLESFQNMVLFIFFVIFFFLFLLFLSLIATMIEMHIESPPYKFDCIFLEKYQ